MSVVRLDSGEFPPLDKMNLDQTSDRKLRSSNKNSQFKQHPKYNNKKRTTTLTTSSQTSSSSSSAQTSRQINSTKQPKNHNLLDGSSQDEYQNCDMDTDDNTHIDNNLQAIKQDDKHSEHRESLEVPQSNNFFFCRVGYQQNEYLESLHELLNISEQFTDFISAPIQNKLSIQANSLDQINIDDFLPDLAMHNDYWQTRVNVEIGHEYVDNYHFGSAKKFEFQLRHALYLTCPSILVTVPDSEGSILSIASVVNDRLGDTSSPVRLTFQIPFQKREAYLNSSSWGSQSSPEKLSSLDGSNNSISLDKSKTSPKSINNGSGLNSCTRFPPENKSSSTINHNQKTSHWNQWNQLRNLLNIDTRIGVALTVSEDLLDENIGPMNRWVGEPVRFLIIPAGMFIMTEGKLDSLRLSPRSKKFIQMVVNSNSMKTNLILQTDNSLTGNNYTKNYNQYRNHLAYLQMFTDNLKLQNQDPLTEWNDKIQPPLQPLSSNLDSSTYTVFELDPVKYIKYRDAIKLALETIITREQKQVKKRDLVLMVLGAGRGPLVDSMLEAIESIESNPHNLTIFALDKNPSSVRSLRYKLNNKWKTSDNLKIHVINADMRAWHPGVKADLIASELLGSLSDNELSPECIDGASRFANPQTISIPVEYTSYIAPICSQKLRVALREEKLKTNRLVYDQIYVAKLSNYFSISSPQGLFRFEHTDFDEEYLRGRTNERYIKLSFWSDEDTVCHGFAGYFSARLFGSVSISTLKGSETEGMFSWFPAFIPLEVPVQMPKSTRLDLHFWRKESQSRVWYEWAVTHPNISRIHGQNGNDTAMSKFI